MKPSFRVVLPLVGLMACVGDDPVAAPVVDAGAAEASVADAGADAPSTAACDPNKDFGPPVLVEELRSNLGESGFSMNAAQTVAIFGRGNDVIQVRRSGPDAPFTGAAPLQLPPAPGAAGQRLAHSLSSDGLIILRTASDVLGPYTDTVSRPTVDAAFGAPTQLTLVNGSPFLGRYPHIAADGSRYYWLGSTPDGLSALLQGDRIGNVVSGGIPVTDFNPGTFVLSYDGLTLYFTRNYTVRRATRATLSDKFAGSQEIATLTLPQGGDGGLVYASPTHVTRDDCSLYVTIRRTEGGGISVAKRPK
jgi:hypothetical protein